MKIELDTENINFYKIISYSDHGFQLKDRSIHSNLIISKQRLIENWLEEGHEHLATQHLEQIISWKPKIILLGTRKNKLSKRRINLLCHH